MAAAVVDMRSPDLVLRWVELEGAANARCVIPSVLLRADNLQSLTSRDVRVLLDEEAVEVIVDLRTDNEVRLEGPTPISRESRVRVEHRSLYPNSGSTDLELEIRTADPDGSAAHQSQIVRAYLNYLRRRPDSVVGAIRTIARAERAVLVHCAAGKDRTGVVVALALEAARIDRKAVLADYLATGERLEPIMQRLLRSPTYRGDLLGVEPSTLAPMPEAIEGFLETVDRSFGGSAAWLSAHGLSHADLARLRRRLRPRA